MADAAPEPTAGELRSLIVLVVPAFLLAAGLLVLSNVAILFALWGRR